MRLFSLRWCSVLVALAALGLAGCGGSGGGGTPRIVTPDGVAEPGWTPEEREREIAFKVVRTSKRESLFWVRARGAEKPHYHDKTDMTVFVVSGRVLMHLGERAVHVGAGDVIDIPRGTLHWVENASKEASVAFVVFSPGFDGSDLRRED